MCLFLIRIEKFTFNKIMYLHKNSCSIVITDNYVMISNSQTQIYRNEQEMRRGCFTFCLSVFKILKTNLQK